MKTITPEREYGHAYDYDSAGNIICDYGSRGVATTYTYDNMNRMVEKELKEVVRVLKYDGSEVG